MSDIGNELPQIPAQSNLRQEKGAEAISKVAQQDLGPMGDAIRETRRYEADVMAGMRDGPVIPMRLDSDLAQPILEAVLDKNMSSLSEEKLNELREKYEQFNREIGAQIVAAWAIEGSPLVLYKRTMSSKKPDELLWTIDPDSPFLPPKSGESAWELANSK